MKLSQKNRSELIIAGCFAIPAFIALVEIHTKFVAKGMHTGGGEQNAALFPRILSYLLLTLVLAKIIGILIKAHRTGNNEDRIIFFERTGIKQLLAIFFAFIIYIIGLSTLGFYVATPLVLIAFFVILGIHKIVLIIPLSLGITLSIWYIFGVLLKVVLPVGRFGLYF